MLRARSPPEARMANKNTARKSAAPENIQSVLQEERSFAPRTADGGCPHISLSSLFAVGFGQKKRRVPGGRALEFSLYFQNSKLNRVIRQIFELYICRFSRNLASIV